MYTHLQSFEDGTQLASVAEKGTHAYFVLFDQEGFMLPYLETQRLFQEFRAGHYPTDPRNQMARAWAVGSMDDALYAAIPTAADEVVAPYFPEVPEWLATAPPIRALLLPNGNVATFGSLGSGSTEKRLAVDAGCPCESDLSSGTLSSCTRYLYGPYGTLLGESKILTYPIPESLPGNPLSKGRLKVVPGGYLEFEDAVHGKVTSVWDFDGKYLGTALPSAQRPMQPFQALPGWQILRLYQAQQKLKAQGKSWHMSIADWSSAPKSSMSKGGKS
jgi:hypothetical protein